MRRGSTAGWGCACLAAILTALVVAFAVFEESGRAAVPSQVFVTGTGTGRVVVGTVGLPPALECRSACEYTESIAGQTVVAEAIPDSGSRFDGWGGACFGSPGTTCSFLGTEAGAAIIAVFSALNPPAETPAEPPAEPPTESAQFPTRGQTRVVLSSFFVNRLHSLGWTIKAIAPARLQGRVLTLPIARSGKVTIFHQTSPLEATLLDGSCTLFPVGNGVVHHAGGIRLAAPATGRKAKQALRLDIPAIHEDVLLFRDARTAGSRRERSGKAEVGLLLDLNDTVRALIGSGPPGSAAIELKPTLRASFSANSWDGLPANSPVPPFHSGTFATITVAARVPADACG
jgi:hypothetical protein